MSANDLSTGHKPLSDRAISLAHVQGDCIRCNYIDSWCKLYTILWFCERRTQHFTIQELGEGLYQRDEWMISTMLAQLVKAGFLVEEAGRFGLSVDPQVTACLDRLVETFADPLARQQLIESLRAIESGERGPCHEE